MLDIIPSRLEICAALQNRTGFVELTPAEYTIIKNLARSTWREFKAQLPDASDSQTAEACASVITVALCTLWAQKDIATRLFASHVADLFTSKLREG